MRLVIQVLKVPQDPRENWAIRETRDQRGTLVILGYRDPREIEEHLDLMDQ